MADRSRCYSEPLLHAQRMVSQIVSAQAPVAWEHLHLVQDQHRGRVRPTRVPDARKAAHQASALLNAPTQSYWQLRGRP